MAEKTTSAGQLHKIISRAYKKPSNHKTIEVWSDLLNSVGANPMSVSKKFSELITLFDNVKRDFNFLDESYRQIGLDALSNIQSPIIYHGLRTIWDEIKKEINESDIHLIKMCDGMLQNQGVCQNLIEGDKVSELLEQVNELINDFRDSELPNELKSQLIKELIKIQTALYDFDIKGEANLQKVCQEVTGDIIANSSQNPKLYKKFIQPVQKVINTVVVIGGLMTTADLSIKYRPVLTAQIVRFIESLPDEPTENQALLEGATDPLKR